MEDQKDRKKTEKKKGKRGIGYYVSYVVTVAAVALLIYAGAHFYTEYRAYQIAGEEYKKLDALMQVEENAGSAESTAEETTEEADTETTQTLVDEETGLPEVSVPSMDIDFEELSSINSDFACVIYVPALDLTYPVAYSSDNNEYLHETFQGTKNASGCIFVDRDAARDFTDLNTLIFGHNMKNMTMFGSLKRFSQDETLCDTDPYFYLYFEGKTYQYRIFSYYVVSNRDSTVYGKVTNDSYESFVDSALKRSQYSSYDDAVDFSGRPLLVTLSTCFGTAHTENYVVHGALVGVHTDADSSR